MSESRSHIENSIALRDALIEKLRSSGISVNTDWQEGERVLQQENGRNMNEHFAESIDEFDVIRDLAVREVGIVIPYLLDKEVDLVFVPNHDFDGSGKDALQKAEIWAKENLTGIHHATDHLGKTFEYNISRKALHKYLSSDCTDKSENLGVHLAALKVLPDIIGKSIEAEIHPDYHKGDDDKRHIENGHGDDILVHRFYGACDIEGNLYRVKTTMLEFRDETRTNRPHSYEVTKIELLDGLSNSPRREMVGSNPSISAAKLLNNVEKSYDFGKNLLEESKKSVGIEELLRQKAQIGFSQQVVEEKIGPRLTMNNYNDIRKINPFMSFLWSDKVPEFIDYREAVPVPTFDDYFVATRADFEYIGCHIAMQPGALITAEHENQQRWADMVASGKYEHQNSPRSNSEYLLDHETGDIYRFSNHWGRVASCQWSIDTRYGTEDTEIYGIGKCNIKDFKPVSSERRTHNPAYAAPYVDALQKTISNYETLLKSHVEITDAARQRIETRLESYRRLQTLFNEKGYTESRYTVRLHQVDNALSTVLAGEITRQDVERTMDSRLVKSWLKAKNSNDFAAMQGFNLFGSGTMLVHEFAKARLGIDNKFEPGKMFYNSWELIEDLISAAKEEGLDVAIANKYVFQAGSEDVQRIMEDPENMYSEQEMAEISKHLSPAAFNDFSAAVRSLFEAKQIQAEEERIMSYQNGDAVTKAFVLYDIAQRRLFAEHEGDERYFRQQRIWSRPDDSQGVLTKAQNATADMTVGTKWVLKNDVAHELMHMIATSPITEQVPLLDMMPSAMQRYLDIPSQEERLAVLQRLTDNELDAVYFAAMPDNDVVMRDVLNIFAERRGYTLDSSYQGSLAFNGAAPSGDYYGSTEERLEAWDNEELEGAQTLGDYINHGVDIGDLDFRLNDPRGGINMSDERLDAINSINQAIREGHGTIKMYRAVSATIEEGQFRNGDWITPSLMYAQEHVKINGWDNYRIIEQEVSVNDIWWDGNDIAEWGYDDGKDRRYKNTLNNVKSDDLITRDDMGEVIPPSLRFNDRSSDIRFMYVPNSQSPIFVSNAKLALDKIKQDKATPMQWLKMLEKNGGVKSGEDRWTGLSDWLRSNTDARVLTKQDILSYINENSIRVEEVRYMDRYDYDSIPRFAEYQQEFEDIAAHLDDLWADADKEYADFMERMQDKYEDWEYEMTNEEILEEGELLRNRERYSVNEADRSAYDVAFDVMVSRHDLLFGSAFGHEDGHLYIRDASAARQILPVDHPIHNVRLDYTTKGLTNKREIALVVPTAQQYKDNDEIHFGDAGDGRAVAWVRFGDATSYRERSEAEIMQHAMSMPTAASWHELYDNHPFPGYKSYYNWNTGAPSMSDSILEKDGVFHIQFKGYEGQVVFNRDEDKASLERVFGTFGSLEAAVAAYNEFITRRDHRMIPEKTLVIDEIQSKRHQDGRELGYASAFSQTELDEARQVSREYSNFLYDKYIRGQHPGDDFLDYANAEERQRFDELTSRVSSLERLKMNAVPDTPFEKNWHELALKRMLRYAAENGYDRVAWTNGLQQAERYSLGGKVESIFINHSHRDPKLYSISVFDRDANIISSVSPDDATEEDVRNLFGKNIADQLLQGVADLDRKKARGEAPRSEAFSIQGQNLEVGGEGMKAFYDKMLPSFMNKYGKQWGVQTETIDIPAIKRDGSSAGKNLHSVRVTGQMKQDVMEGQPMFFRNGKNQAYGFVHNGTIYIDPRIATAETPIHEYTHLWAEVLRQRNPQEWSNIVRLMKETPEVWNYVKQSYPHLLTDDQIADEALAQFSGKRGYERLQALVDGKQDEDTILSKMYAVLESFWKSVAEFFNVHYTNKEEVADRILYDLLSEVNPLDYKVQEFDGLVEQSDETISFTLADAINEERVKTNQHFIKDRNELSADEREIQQKAWRAVFHSLSEVKSSSEMPRHTDVPGTSYSASKPIVGANLGRISGIYDQLNTLLREINNKDLSREQFANMLAGSLGLYLDKDKVSRYSEEPIVLRNGEKISLRISNHSALSVNFVRWQNQKEEAYGFVFRDGSKGRFDDDKRVNYLEIDYYKDSLDNASVTARRDLYRDIVNGIKFMLEEGSLEMLPFPDHLNASGRFKEPLLRFRESHPEMLFHEETQINSWNFKEWFGDWEKQQRILKLKNSTDAVISGDEIVLTNDIRQNRKNALAYGKSLSDVYVNKDTGDKISLTAGNSRGGLREILQHDFLDKEHLQSIAAIPQIIENAIFITTEENKDISNYPNVVSFHHYLCGLKIADIDYTVRAVVAVQKNGERYYDHKLSSIEKGKLVELALNGLASPELSSLEEQEDTELLQPTNENRETVKSSVSGYKDKHLFSILQTNCSKVVDENGKPLIVEHGTHADFTVFDINQLGKNSGDNGLFGAGFYFGSKAPGWLNDGSDTHHVMKVYLNIKNPFEISGDTNRDIYTEIKEKLDTPAFRSLTLTGFNGKQIKVGAYIDHIKAVDASISDDPGKIESLIAEDEELAFIHPRERHSVWREHEISRRTGIAVLGLSWQAVISEQLGSREFAAAAKQDGYDGVIVDRGEGYKEYVVFESNQIKSAFNNVGTFLREDNDIRYQLATVSERGNTVFPRRSSVSDREVGQAVVDTLRAMGIAVHTDLLENRRILSEARKDHSESGKIRYMRTQDGHQYGFTYRGENYVDIRMLDGELGVHEYAHLWCEAFRKINPAGWQDVVETISKEEASLSSVRELHPDIASVDDLVEEVIATYSGKRGNERLRSELERMAGRDPDLSSRWGNIFKNISKAIQDFWKNVGYFFNLSYDSAEEVYDQVMKDLAERVNPMYHMDIWLRSRDASYLEAVTSGNLAKAKELLYEALRESVGNGITPFVSAGGYRQGMQALAHGIKQGDKDSINRAATLIAPLVPADAVLVPAPSHRGTADTMLMLANAVSAQTGTPVADVLKGGIRNSQYEAKRAGGYVIPSAAMGIYLEGDLPSGKMPVVIDNVVDTGNTAEACIRALNGGVVISLAKAASGYSHAASLKSMATVLYDVKGDIIPLSRRFELSKSKFLGYLRPPAPRLQPNHQEPKLHTMEETKSQQTMVAESSQSVPPQAIQRLTEAYERLHAEHPEEMILFKSASGLTAISNDALEIFNSTGWFYEPHEYQGKPLPVLILSTEDYELLSEMDFNLRLVNSPVDIKEFRDQLHQLESVSGYHIVIGEDTRLGGVSGEYHVYFDENFPSVSYVDKIALAAQNGGSSRIIDGVGWFDFRSEEEAHRFVDDVVSMARRSEDMSTIYETFSSAHLLSEAQLLDTPVTHTWSSPESGGAVEILHIFSVDGRDCIMLYENMEDAVNDLNPTPLADLSEENKRIVIDQLLKRSLALSSAKSETAEESHVKIDDILLRANELGLEHTPVGLKEQATVYLFDGESAPTSKTYSFATVKGDDITLYESPYDVFEEGKGTSLADIPEDAQHRILDMLYDSFFSKDEKIAVIYDKVEVPSYAMPAILNDDYSGIDNPEDEQDIRSFIERYARYTMDSRPYSSSFSRYPAFGKPTDCTPVFMMKALTPADLIKEKSIREESALKDSYNNNPQTITTMSEVKEAEVHLEEKKEELQQQQSAAEAREQKGGWNIDYSKYVVPAGVTIEKAYVFKQDKGRDAGRWAVQAIVNGERKTRTLFPNDFRAWQKKTATPQQLAVKALMGAVQQAETQKSEAAKESARKQEERKAQQQQEEKRREKEREAQEKSKKEKSPLIPLVVQATLLAGALSAASKREGLWMNRQQKSAPRFYSKDIPVSPFNAMMMGLHSDSNGYNSSVYTTFKMASDNGISVQRNARSLPFDWYNKDSYVNRHDSKDVITKEAYQALSEEDKALYREKEKKQEIPIYNMDQTTLVINKEAYQALIKPEAVEKLTFDEAYARAQAAMPSAVIYMKDIDGNYRVSTPIATEDLKYATISQDDLSEHMSNQVRGGNTVQVVDYEEFSKAGALTASGISALANEFIDRLSVQPNVEVHQMEKSSFAASTDTLVVSKDFNQSAGDERQRAIRQLNNVYRATAAYILAPSRLGHSTFGLSNPLAKDESRFTALVSELSAGVLMARQGLPATLSKESMEMIPLWQEELKDNPRYIVSIGSDLNKTVDIMEKISRGESVDYSVYRRPEARAKVQPMTIVNQLSEFPDKDTKVFVVIRDDEKKSAAVILPNGVGTTPGEEEVSGMNKNRIIKALQKEGFEEIKFYSAEGTNALVRDNNYFDGKRIESVRLKQYTLETVSVHDVSKELDLGGVQFKYFGAGRADDGHWYFNVKDASGGDITVLPSSEDLKKFFDALKKGDIGEVREELANKYYNLVQKYPERNHPDVFMPNTGEIDLNRINSVTIRKDKDPNKGYIMFATIDGTPVPQPKSISKESYQRLFLVADKDAYKEALATVVFAKELGRTDIKETELKPTSEVEEPKDVQDTSQSQPYHRGR